MARSTGKKQSSESSDEVEVLDGIPDEDADESDDELDGGLDGDIEAAGGEAGVALVDVDGDLGLDDPAAGAKPRGRPRAAGGRSVAKYDPMQAYMSEIRHYEVLSREREREIATQFVETGDPDLARQLIQANLRLVVKIAYEYRRAYRNILDLVQEGNIGLLHAVKKYDPERGVKLSSYAAWWIRAYILKFILNNWRLVKIGTTQAQRKLFFNLRKESEKLEQLGFDAEPKLLAERLDVSEKDVVEMQKRLSAPDASLDAPVAGDEDGTRTRMDMLGTEVADQPDRIAEKSQFQSMLSEKLEAFGEGLEGREETIFRGRLLTDTPMTLQEIGNQYGISRERARQIEKRLLGKLRAHLEKEFGGAVDISALGGD